jgi:oligopeptide transport system ATP-binding protein
MPSIRGTANKVSSRPPLSQKESGKDSLLEVKDLIVDFRTADGSVRAVDGVNLQLKTGDTLGLVGESGCGKSQAVLAMLGLLDSNGQVWGSACYRGQELIGLKESALNRVRGVKITMIFQDPMTALNPHLKVGTQLLEVLHQHARLPGKAARQHAIDWLAAVQLPDPARLMQRYPHELSGGQRQRVMIAMSLLCEPEILIADEPTTALDVTVQAEILQLLRELRRRLRMALILITHDLGLVAGICERVMVLYAGRVVESGPTAAVFHQPQHPYTRGLLACMPRLNTPFEQRLPTIAGRPPVIGQRPAGCSFAPRCSYAFTRCEHESPQLVALDPVRAKACHLERLP